MNGLIHAYRWDAAGLAVATGTNPRRPVVAERDGQPLVVVVGSNAIHRITPNGSELPSIPRVAVEAATIRLEISIGMASTTVAAGAAGPKPFRWWRWTRVATAVESSRGGRR
jgi:hypothetical protein